MRSLQAPDVEPSTGPMAGPDEQPEAQSVVPEAEEAEERALEHDDDCAPHEAQADRSDDPVADREPPRASVGATTFRSRREAKDARTGAGEVKRPPANLKAPSVRRGRGLGARASRAVGRALSADPYPADLARVGRSVQQPITTGRRVVVLSTEGGSGRTTVLATLARVFHGLRPEIIAAVDLSSAPSPLGARLGVDQAASGQYVVGNLVLNHPRNAQELREYVAAPSDHLWVSHAASTEDALQELEVVELLTAFSRYVGITLIDCPPVLEDPRTQAALSMAHAALVVGSVSGNGLNNAVELHDLLLQDSDLPHLPVSMVLNDRSADNPWKAKRMRRVLAERGNGHHLMSYDRHLSTGGGVALDHLDERHKLEWVGLAGTALTLSRGAGITA